MTDRQVKVTLVFDDKGSVKVLRKAGEESDHAKGKLDKLDRSVKGIGRSFGGLKGAISSGLGFLGAGSLIFGLGDIASKTKEISEETEKFHTVTGIGTKSSLYYAQALKARGLSGETVNKAFGFLAKNLKSAELQESKFALSQTKAAARGVLTTSVLGKQAGAFKELGINISSFSRLNEQEKLEAVTKAFENLAPGIQKTRLEKELFGRGAEALSTVLEKNNLGLSHQLELVKKYFPTVKGGAHALDELTEKQAESKMAWEGLEFTLGQKLVPAMIAAMGWLSKVAAEAQKGKGPLHEIESTFEGIAHFAGGAIGVAKELFKIFGVKLPAGTLGAVLAAVGIHSIKHPIKSAKAIPNLIKKGLKFTGEHPYAAPITGALLAGGVGGLYLSRATPHGLFPNAERGFLGTGGPPTGNLAKGLSPNTPGGSIGGRATSGGETSQEATIIARAIESLRTTGDHHQYVLNMDGAKVAEGMLRNPRARRQIAEAMTIYAQQMAARR